ncbi:putative prophage protein [Klebsiella quasipneumoniae]|nr:putative prophage protein [Klebsiella quasipneumoniae]
MDESKQTGSRMAAEGSGSASMACGAVHRQTPEAGARCVNSARRDLCGGYPVTGIPTATSHVGGYVDRELNEHVMIERVEMIARLTTEGACKERDREIALGLIAELAKGNLMKNSSFSIVFSVKPIENQ